jgi:uncharacterized membrane protein required for colicin V production
MMNSALDFSLIVSVLLGGGVAAWLLATGNGWNERVIGLAIGILSGQAAMLLLMALFLLVALLHLWLWMPVAQAFADLKSIWAAMRSPPRKP